MGGGVFCCRGVRCDGAGDFALLTERKAATEVAVQVGLGELDEPVAVMRFEPGVAQVPQGGGGQAVKARPVVVRLVAAQLGDEIAEKLLALEQAPGDGVCAAGVAGLGLPAARCAWCGVGQGVVRGVEGGGEGGELAGGLPTHDERAEVPGEFGSQWGGQQRRFGAAQHFGELAGIDDVEQRVRTEELACGLQVRAHGLAPAGKRQPKPPRDFGTRPRDDTESELAQGGAFFWRGELVGAGGLPDVEHERLSEALPPVEQRGDGLAGLFALGGDDMDGGGGGKAGVGALAREGVALGVAGVEVERFGREPADDFRDHRPACTQGGDKGVRRRGQRHGRFAACNAARLGVSAGIRCGCPDRA